MKAVIVKVEGSYASALHNDGTFVRIKNQNYSVGQVIIMKKESAFSKVAMAASAAVAVLTLSLGIWAYAAPYSYVSLDVNPSIEYTLNRFERVLTVKAVNDDGQAIIKEIELKDLKYKTIDLAIQRTVEQINAHDYFKEGGAIVIATSAKDIQKAEALASRLKKEIDSEAKEQGKDVEVEAISVGRTRVEEARELGVTPGKLNLVEKLQDSFDDETEFDMKNWLQKSVKEIMTATKENRKEAKEESEADKQKQKTEKQAEKQDAKEAKENAKIEKKQEKDVLKTGSKADAEPRSDKGFKAGKESKTDKESKANKQPQKNKTGGGL